VVVVVVPLALVVGPLVVVVVLLVVVPFVVPLVVVVVVPLVVVVEPTVVVVVPVLAKHVGTLITLSSRVTAPLRARTRPVTVAPVFIVAELRDIIVPLMLLVVPSVTELPASQKTLQACAPFSRITLLPEAVVSVDPAWKMKTALASPPPLSVTDPVRAMLVDEA
jgi:hypothetical protein